MSIPITGHTGLTALLGSPVAHSVSPLMHNESFRYHNLDYVYLCFDVNEDALTETVRGLRTAGIRGFNLTMPNKNKMVELVDKMSPAAEMIGAINTVVNDDGILTGHNTDGTGFMLSLKDAGHDITNKTVTILGAGGAASSICVQAALDGASTLHIFVRSSSRFWNRMQEIVNHINNNTGCKAYLYDNDDEKAKKDAVVQSNLLINASSVGMAPNVDGCLIPDASYFHPGLVVSDVIYEPRETKLLRMAREAGCETCNGLYMLLYQGAEAFRIWTGKDMPIDLVKGKYFR